MTEQNPNPDIVYQESLPATGPHYAASFRVRPVDNQDRYVRVQVTYSAVTTLEGYRGRPFSGAEIETFINCWGTETIRRYLGEGKQLPSKMSLTSKQLPEVSARQLLRRCGLD